jgi:hypothetical protein
MKGGLGGKHTKKPIPPLQTPSFLSLSGEERNDERSRAFDDGIHAMAWAHPAAPCDYPDIPAGAFPVAPAIR